MTTEREDKLTRDAAKLAQAIAPERDLWPDIEASIDGQAGPRARRWTPYFAQAAAIVLLVGASSGLTYLVTQGDDTVSPVATPSGLTLESASWGGEMELSSDYKLARNDLQSQLDNELARLSPETRADVEQNLTVIRNAIAEINAALEQEPDNVLLQELLLSTYREELAVMRKVGGLTQDVMSRNDI